VNIMGNTTIQVSEETQEKLKEHIDAKNYDEAIQNLLQKSEKNGISIVMLVNLEDKDLLFTENGLQEIIEKEDSQ